MKTTDTYFAVECWAVKATISNHYEYRNNGGTVAGNPRASWKEAVDHARKCAANSCGVAAFAAVERRSNKDGAGANIIRSVAYKGNLDGSEVREIVVPWLAPINPVREYLICGTFRVRMSAKQADAWNNRGGSVDEYAVQVENLHVSDEGPGEWISLRKAGELLDAGVTAYRWIEGEEAQEVRS